MLGLTLLPGTARAATPAQAAHRFAKPIHHKVARRPTAAEQALAAPLSTGPARTAAGTSFAGAWSEVGAKPEYDELNPAGTPLTNSGRIAALVIDPTNASNVYVGAAGGGVWKSTDGGATWSPISDSLASLAIGSLAISADGGTLYAGTGENNLAIDSQPGQGIYRSVSGGAWTQVAGASLVGTRVNSLAVDQYNASFVFAATNTGLWSTTNGGALTETWTRDATIAPGGANHPTALAGPVSGAIQSIAQDLGDTASASGSYWLTATDTCGSEAGDVYYGGWNSWSKRLTVTPPFDPSGSAQIGLGASASGGYAYISISSCNPVNFGGFDAAYRWTPAASRWTKLSLSANYFSVGGGGGQGWYDNVVAVSPGNADFAVFGGVDIWATENGTSGGGSFKEIACMYSGCSTFQPIHPDQHAIAFAPAGAAAPASFLVGDDGGLWKTADMGGYANAAPGAAADWSGLNGAVGGSPLGTIQYYAGSTLDDNHYLGGAQDNGTSGIYPGSCEGITCPSRPAMFAYCGGDGAFTAIESGATRAYCEYEFGTSSAGSMIWFNPTTGTRGDAGPCEVSANPACSDTSAWAAPFIQDAGQSGRLFAATTKIYRSTWTPGATPVAGAGGWTAITNNLGTSISDAIVELRQLGTTDTLLATTQNGEVALISSAASTAVVTDITGNLGSVRATGDTNFPAVADAAFAPGNASEVWAVSARSGSGGHVLHTINAGPSTSWSDVSGTLGNLLVNTIVADPSQAGTIYIGTSAGVFICTACAGAAPVPNWTPAGIGLPNAWVDELTISADGNNLVAWTHGRGAWKLSLAALSYLAVSSSTPAPTAGVPFSVTVTAKTVSGATLTAYAGTVHFTSSDGQAGLPPDYTFTVGDAGTHTFTNGVTLKTAGSQTVAATDTVTNATGSVTEIVSPANASHFRVSAPATAGPDAAFTVSLTALDPFANTATGYTGTVHFTSSDPNSPLLPADYTFTSADAGAHTFTDGVTLMTLGSQTVAATDTVSGSVTGSATVTVAYQPGSFRPVTPFRILDTRNCTPCGAPIGPYSTPFGAETVRTLQVTGSGGIPSSGVTAVVLNVTATDTTESGFFTIYPQGAPRPNASNVNFVSGQTVPNLVQVAVGNGGQVDLYNYFGSADMIIDVAGYFTSGGGSNGLFNPVAPARVMDTRQCSPCGAPIGPYSTPFSPGQTRSLTIAAGPLGGVPSGASGVVLNVTVTNPSNDGFLTLFPDGAPRPNASNVNFVPGQTVPNRVYVKLGGNGAVDIYNFNSTTDVIIDVNGYFSDGASITSGYQYYPLAPVRIIDTRQCTPCGAPIGPYGSPLGAGTVDVVSVSTAGARAVVANVTTTDTTQSSFYTLYPDGTSRPNASDLNWVAGETVPNLTVTKLSSAGKLDVYNYFGNADLIIDVNGYYGP